MEMEYLPQKIARDIVARLRTLAPTSSLGVPKRLVCAFTLGILVFWEAFPASANVARFGYYWKDRTLPYTKEFSYDFDVAVYPDGVFADADVHSWAYITSQHKHIVYNGVPYSVEAVVQYGFFTDNANAIKRFWVAGIDDSTRFISWWLDDDADGHDYWELSTLQNNGYLFRQTDPDGDELWLYGFACRRYLFPS
ncbi:MAG TPA: hypothetical protein VLK82_17925 [Candidatus Tectomicrobia bacterium]|nr:hypothetical protein [Candidatus Tectomicrobia bacterium]